MLQLQQLQAQFDQMQQQQAAAQQQQADAHTAQLALQLQQQADAHAAQLALLQQQLQQSIANVPAHSLPKQLTTTLTGIDHTATPQQPVQPPPGLTATGTTTVQPTTQVQQQQHSHGTNAQAVGFDQRGLSGGPGDPHGPQRPGGGNDDDNHGDNRPLVHLVATLSTQSRMLLALALLVVCLNALKVRLSSVGFNHWEFVDLTGHA